MFKIGWILAFEAEKEMENESEVGRQEGKNKERGGRWRKRQGERDFNIAINRLV